MSEEKKEPETTEEEEIQSVESQDSNGEFQKKELSEEESKEIFGDSEKTEVEEILEIYRDKKPYEIELHKEFGIFPNEWIQEEVVNLMKSDHALIRNWHEVNDWIREIAVKLNSGVLIANKVKEFCPAQCANPLLIDRKTYGFVEDTDVPLEEQIWSNAVMDCLSCPLYAYGNVNAFDHRPDESHSKVKVGQLVVEPEDNEDEQTIQEDSEPTEDSEPSDLSEVQ